MRWRVIPERKRERWREKKNNKILNVRAICTVTVANVQICTLLEALMWSIIKTKCVKFVSFSIMQDVASTDVNALRIYRVELWKMTWHNLNYLFLKNNKD